MPAYLLVKAQDAWNPDEPMVFNTGFPVSVLDRDQLNGLQIPPKFVQFVITDGTVAQVQAYCQIWRREIDWSFISHDFAADSHRLNVFAKPELVSASGLNSLTRAMVETFLGNWKASVVSIAANSVVFDAKVFDAITSNAFWRIDVSGGAFNETSYDQPSGLHTIRLTYSGIAGANSSNVEEHIAERGCAVISRNIAQSRVTFTCSRDNVFSVFKQDVQEKTYENFSLRKWYFTQAAVDAALAAGGSLEVTRLQALAYLHNRLTD